VVIATVEDAPTKRLARARLESPSGLVVDLIASTSGIEHEIVSRSTLVRLDGMGLLPVARAEELLAMKVLSMTDRRLQDRIDARNLVRCSADLDREAVRDDVALIEARGFARGQDLQAKLAGVLEDAGRDD